MQMPAAWRRLALFLHVVTSVGFVGAVAAFLALAIAGATAADGATLGASYLAMDVITARVILPLAAATLVVGIVQSLGTPWGLFRYYWIVVKLVLTIIAIVVLLLQVGTIELLAAEAIAGDLANLAGARVSMLLHSAGGVVVLLAATLLSIYKPRGLTPYGLQKLSAPAWPASG